MKVLVITFISLLYANQLYASNFPTGFFKCQVEEKYCSEFESSGFPEECRKGSEISVEISSVQIGSKEIPYVVYKTSFSNIGGGYNPDFERTQEGLGSVGRFTSAADPVLAITLPSVISIQFFSEGNDSRPYVSDMSGNDMYACKK